MSFQHFYKYQGAGNDFVIIDARFMEIMPTEQEIARFCDRRFGVGGDGLMLLKNSEEADFEMLYYNSDGRLGSMCGNGGRCITAFARKLGLIGKKTCFKGYDGMHEAEIISEEDSTIVIKLKMRNINTITPCLNGFFLDTGSPHYVEKVEQVRSYPVTEKGAFLRSHTVFPNGTNVDFVEVQPDGSLFVRTYERGVDAETYSCGTGVTASALVYAQTHPHIVSPVDIHSLGGDFKVFFKRVEKGFSEVWLQGNATLVFEGEIDVSAQF